MKEKKIAIYLVATVMVFAIIIGVTVYMVTGSKKVKNNNSNQKQSNILENIDLPVRTVKQVYENQIYTIELYTDGTATARIKPEANLWGDLETSNDEKYKKEKNELKTILIQSRQIDSNNRKIEQVFVSNYIGDVYNNYYYGKAIIKCEGNVFYLIDLVSDKKIRISEDWTEKCREVNSDKIIINLQNECLSELLKNETLETNKNFSGVSPDNKYKYIVSFNEKDEYGIYIHSNESGELLLYCNGKITEENTQISAGTSYYKFNFVKPNGGVVNGTIKQTNVIPESVSNNNVIVDTSNANKPIEDVNSTSTTQKNTSTAQNDSVIDVEKPIYLEIQDLSTQSNLNFTTDGYYELKISKNENVEL